jgi:4-diphosphocytidyl-2-C-methyl-D-erythritol kinase
MPTPAVYKRFDEMQLGSDLAKVERALPDPSLTTLPLLRELVNDLEAPAFAISPELAQLRHRCEALLRRPVRMSGSGSTLFTLYDAPEDALDAARMTSALGVKSLACETAVLG